MTTPRVTVPVEPTKAMINHAVGHIGGGSTFDTDDRQEIAQSVYRAMLSAAPAPEGGAVATWHPIDDNGSAEVRVNGRRITSMPSYPAAQEAAERINAALATREEAPARRVCDECGFKGTSDDASKELDYCTACGGNSPTGGPDKRAHCDAKNHMVMACPKCGGRFSLDEDAREEAPEPSAEWFGVTGAADETEALAVALFVARCPGVRMTDEDLHHYRSAAQRAMQVVSAELSGNLGQLEAPAEAGAQEIALALREARNRLHSGRVVLGDIDAIMDAVMFLEDQAALRAQPQARAWGWDYEICTGCSASLTAADIKAGGHVSCCPDRRMVTVRDLVEAYDAQLKPQAREDAGLTVHLVSDGGDIFRIKKWENHGLREGSHRLYTRPAPDALRVAVEALTEARQNLIDCGDHFGAGRCADAIAALQAEQKGGAA